MDPENSLQQPSHAVDSGVSRRRLLKRAVAASALLGTAGCTRDSSRDNTQPTADGDGQSGDGPTPIIEYSEATIESECPPASSGPGAVTGNSTSPRMNTPEDTDGDMEIASISVSDFIQYALSGTHPVVTREPHTQYVTVRCDTPLSWGTVRDRLTLHLDGESIPVAGRQPYAWQHDTVDLAFSVPKGETYAGGAVVVDGTERRSLSGATVERLNDPPAFEVSRLSVSPDSIRPEKEATAEVQFTLENTCRGRGTFGASISGAVSGYSLVTATLDPGEQREITAEARIVGRSNGSASRVALRWGTNSLVATIPVVGAADE